MGTAPDKPDPPLCEDCRTEQPLPNCRKCFECRDKALDRCGAKVKYGILPYPIKQQGSSYVPGVGGASWNELTDYVVGHE